MASEEPILRLAQIMKQEPDDISEYVKQHQALNIEGRLGEMYRRDKQKQRQKRKRESRQDSYGFIQINAEEKRRADEIHMTQFAADRGRDQAKIEANKELAIKELELQAQVQVNTDATSNPSPRMRRMN